MREILFRGKCKDDSEWVYGVPVLTIEKYQGRHDFSDRTIIMPDQSLVIEGEYDEYEFDGSMVFFDELPREVIPSTVGQFTGLYDKNGNKVFEGDIIEIYEDGGEAATGNRAVIEYGHYNCGCCHCVYGFASSNENDYYQALRFLFEKPPTSEALEACRVCGDGVSVIIGNIHDNPELVKEERK